MNNKKRKIILFFLGLFLILLSCILYCSKNRKGAGKKYEIINVQLLMFYIIKGQ
jgi:hypothetical protein